MGSNLTLRAIDLPGLTLGEVIGNTVFIDINAAGYGWDYDPTKAVGGMDLLTVLAHEFGHVLGFEHEQDSLMAPTMEAGVLSSFGRVIDERESDEEQTDQVDEALLVSASELAIPKTQLAVAGDADHAGCGGQEDTDVVGDAAAGVPQPAEEGRPTVAEVVVDAPEMQRAELPVAVWRRVAFPHQARLPDRHPARSP